MCNLKETFRSFKGKYPDIKIGFSKFAELWPKHCILPGTQDMHSVCVCAHHENVKLMFNGMYIFHLTTDSDFVLWNYKDCLSQIICNPPSPECYLRKCVNCPGTENLVNNIWEIFKENTIEQVTYKQWVTVDHTNLKIIQSPVEDFLEKLSVKLSNLLTPS